MRVLKARRSPTDGQFEDVRGEMRIDFPVEDILKTLGRLEVKLKGR